MMRNCVSKWVKRNWSNAHVFGQIFCDRSLFSGKSEWSQHRSLWKGVLFSRFIEPPYSKKLRTFSSPITAHFEKYFFSYATSTSPFDPDNPISPFENAARIEKSVIFGHRESSIQIFVTQHFNNCFTHQQSWYFNELRIRKYY